MTTILKTWEEFPSYFELFLSFWEYVNGNLRNDMNLKINPLPAKYWTNLNFTVFDLVITLIASITLTGLRYLSSKMLFEPLGRKYNLKPSNQKKMPESFWKFTFWISVWSYNFYILILSGEYQLLQNPSTIWVGWNVMEPVPMKIYILYVAQCGFYLHSLYAVLFLDEIRKDFYVMVIHHFKTLLMLLFSYSLRYHNMGALALLTLDISDIFLEMSKVTVYFKEQNGKVIWIIDMLSYLSLFFFIVVWFYGRLYLFPLRILYNSMNHLPYMSIINAFLWTLQFFNIYWTFLIFKLIFRTIVFHQSPEDLREYDIQERKSS